MMIPRDENMDEHPSTALAPREAPCPATKGAVGKAHGTFGELLQGSLPGEDGHFLVTLPINRFAYATFFKNDRAGSVIVKPPHKTKSRDLALSILQAIAPRVGGELVLRGDLEEGKGLSSSSADLVATSRAIAAAIGKEVDLNVLLTCMGRLEPSDGVMFDTCIVFHHRRVIPGQVLGSPPSIRIYSIDEGGTIDTVCYNKALVNYAPSEEEEYSVLLGRLATAFRDRDLELLGSVCTRGAYLNQKRNPKILLDTAHAISDRCGALGVVVTHSGTVLGIMLSHYDDAFEEKEANILAALSRLDGRVMAVDSLSYNKQGDRPW